MKSSCLVSENQICRNCRYPLPMDSVAFSMTGDEIQEKSRELPPDSLSLHITAGRIIMVWVLFHLPNFMFMFLTKRGCQFSVAAGTNYQVCDGLKQRTLFSHNSGGRQSNMGFPGLKSVCWQGHISSRDSIDKCIFLTFLASEEYSYSLVHYIISSFFFSCFF